MDNSIEELFKQKNGQILVDKLLLDIANNDDSLRLTINNKILLITDKLQKKINDFLKNNGIKYDLKSLSELLLEHKEKTKQYILQELDARKQKYEENVRNSDTLKIEKFDEDVSTIHDRMNPRLNEFIYIDLFQELLQTYELKSPEQQEELTKCLKTYDSKLSLAIETSILERNNSLRNIISETISKVEELDNKAKTLSRNQQS